MIPSLSHAVSTEFGTDMKVIVIPNRCAYYMLEVSPGLSCSNSLINYHYCTKLNKDIPILDINIHIHNCWYYAGLPILCNRYISCGNNGLSVSM